MAFLHFSFLHDNNIAIRFICYILIFTAVFLFVGASPFKPPFSSAVSDNTLHKFGSNGLLHTSAETSLVSLHVNLPSYPSPSPSPIGSPVTSPTGSPSFPHRPCPSNINWAFRRHGRALNVYEWLRRLRLHKYFDVFRGKTFDEVCEITCQLICT